MTWTHERNELLTQLWTEGNLPCSKIADEMRKRTGIPFTRNAIIGKVTRLGLPLRGPGGNRWSRPFTMRGPGEPRTRKVTPRKPRVKSLGPPVTTPEGAQLREQRKRLRSKGNGGLVESPNIADASMNDDTIIPQSQRKQLFDLENRHCRWPIGNPGTPDFFFCGDPSADVMGSRPYCARHARDAGRKYDGGRGSYEEGARRAHQLRLMAKKFAGFDSLNKLDEDAA